MVPVVFLPAVLAIIVFGHVGLRTATRNGVGRGGSIIGLVLGYLVIVLSVGTTVMWILAAAASSSTTTVVGS